MAHKKAGGSTALGRDSNAQRLGIKVGDGQTIKAGGIIVRQRGIKIRPGVNTERGVDDTIYAVISGVVKFNTRKIRRYTGELKQAKFVNVVAA